MQLTQAKAALTAWQTKLSAYNHAISLIYYDGATTAPKGTAANRAHTLGILSEECYRLSTDKETEILAFTRTLGGETYVILGNFTEKTVDCSCVIPEGNVTEILASGVAYEKGEAFHTWLNPYGYLVLKIQ
jgi:Zn-dependent M32 family carboxypeptidase